ncbi:MAG: TolC family protein [Rikenellaceae bacterium]|nr:TolC family protein [Rikenellaceae bacterium]
MKKIVLISAVAFVLGGCGIYTKYQRPAVDDVVNRLYTPSNPDDSTSIAMLEWEDLFADERLQALIRTGLRNNTDLNVARLKVAEAEATLQTSRLAYVPSVAFEADGSVKNTNFEQTSTGASAGFSVGWEVDIFGRLTNAKRGAQAALIASESYRQAVQTQLVATIADSYYTLLMLDQQLAISRRTLDTWEENIRTMEALKRAGKTNEAAVLQAKSNRLSVEGSVLTLTRQIAQQQNSLCALLGVTPHTIRRGELAEQSFPEVLHTGVPAQLLSRRPDVRQAEMNLAQAFYNTNAARSEFYPKITLGGTLGWRSAGAAIANPSSWILNAVAGLVQPVFAKGQNKARLRTAQARQEQALLQFRQSLLDAGTEVNNALIQWQTAKERLEIDKRQIVHLRAAVWNTKLLMKHGLTNYLEVLTAQQNLLQAELTEISDKYAEIQGVIHLYHALGGGVE